jgi:hypothetical protein
MASNWGIPILSLSSSIIQLPINFQADGLLVNFTVGTHRNAEQVDRCDLWDQLMESLDRTNGEIGGGRLSVAPDLDLLDPCAEPLPQGEQCAGTICNQALGEVNNFLIY